MKTELGQPSLGLTTGMAPVWRKRLRMKNNVVVSVTTMVLTDVG